MAPLNSGVRCHGEYAVDGNGGYAVGWITLSFINAALAQTKNRDGALWWLGSLLLGPIATFLIAVLHPLERTKPTRTEGDANDI